MRSAPLRPLMVLGLAVPMKWSSPSVPWQVVSQTLLTPSWARATPASTSSASVIDAINSMVLFKHASLSDVGGRTPSPRYDFAESLLSSERGTQPRPVWFGSLLANFRELFLETV